MKGYKFNTIFPSRDEMEENWYEKSTVKFIGKTNMFKLSPSILS